MKIKKILRKVKRKSINIYKKIKFSIRRPMTLKKVCHILDIEVPKEYKKIQNIKVKEITRSRLELTENCLFFCKNLNRFKEEEEQIKKLSLCVFSEEPIDGCNNIVIPNTFKSYTKIMKYIRELVNPRVIAVTGSIGKTSTKDMIRSVLRRKYKNMLASTGNSNSHYKIAKNIKRLSPLDKIYLQEVGLGGEKVLFKENSIMLEPEVAVYTNILDAHIEHFGSREKIAEYKTQLSKYGKENGLAIINYDDPILRKVEFTQEVVSYSLKNKKATYYAKDIKVSSEGTSFKIIDNKENNELEVNLTVIGEHHIQNALAAYAVGKYLKMKDKTILNGLKKYKTTGMRQNIISVGDYKVFADCYNASLDSIETAVKTMEYLTPEKNGKKLAIIGDVFSLGEFSEEIHKNIGKMLVKYNLDEIVFFGNDMEFAYNEYKKEKKNARYIKERDVLHEYVEKVKKEGDIVLFKASHGMHLTESIDFLFGTDMSDSSNVGENDYKEIEEKDYKYYEFPYNATITEYLGNDKNIKLPEMVNKKQIHRIGKEVFKDNKEIESIILSNKISKIKKEAFENSSIKKITFNKLIKTIGQRAFYNCENLKEISLPQGLITIEQEAFAKCKNLKKIVVPNSVRKISNNAFEGNSNLVMYGEKDSYAENYAKENNIKFKRIEEKK